MHSAFRQIAFTYKAGTLLTVIMGNWIVVNGLVSTSDIKTNIYVCNIMSLHSIFCLELTVINSIACYFNSSVIDLPIKNC